MPSDRQRGPVATGRLADDGREWLTLGQAAAFLGAAQSTVRKWADSGRLPAFYTPGGHRRFRRMDLEAFLTGGRAAPVSAGRILVVDDDAALRAFVRASLEGEGHLVREARSAEEGLAALEEELPDLILLDVMMPGVDGWEMLRRVHERHGMGSIPVIMFSGQAEISNDDAVARGAQAFLGKPFNPQDLVARTKELLRA